MSTSPPLLEYGPRPRCLRRRRTRRVILLALLGFACFAGYHWWKPVKQKALMLYWQRHYMNYSDSPDTIAYEEDPTQFSKLLASRPEYRLSSRPSYVWLAPRSWNEFAPAWMDVTPEQLETAPVLLHGIRSPNGTERLVAVCVGGASWGEFLWGGALDLGDLIHDPKPSGTGCSQLMWLRAGLGEKLRFYTGEVDPHDASHFTIEYAIDGRRGKIDGRLGNTGTVVLTLRGGMQRGTLTWIPPASKLFRPPTTQDLFSPTH